MISATDAHTSNEVTVSSGEDLLRWNQVADLYAQTVGGDADSFYRRFAPFMWHHLGDIAGRRVLDMGCGHGWLATKLHQAGARVAGIDGSTRLIEAARSQNSSIEFHVHDLTHGLPSPAQTYDRIVSHMVLMDMPTIDPLLADTASSLSMDGVFIFSILHPCFFSQPPVQDPSTGQWQRRVQGYLDHEQRWIESFGGHTHYHRPLAWYVDRLADHGLAVTGIHEPPTLPNHTNPIEEWTDYERWFSTIPTMIAFACRRLSPEPAGHTHSEAATNKAE